MAEKHLKSKETDITGVLVITCTLLVAGLIIKVASDFTKQTTSTSTKASVKTIKTGVKTMETKRNDETCRKNKPFADKQYNSSRDYCRMIGTVCESGVGGVATNFVRDIRSDKTSKCGLTGSDCCRNNEQLYTYTDFYGKIITERRTIDEALGTKRCVRETNHAEAICVATDKTNTNNTLTKANIPCALNRNNYQSNSMLASDDVIVSGECYYNATAPTIIPPAIQPNGMRVDSCGPQYLNCQNTWGANTINTNNAGNKDKNGVVLAPECQGAAGQGIESYHCGMRVDNSVTTCDGGQWANPTLLNNGILNECYMTEKGALAVGTTGQLFKVCAFKPTKDIAAIGVNLPASECKAKAIENMN